MEGPPQEFFEALKKYPGEMEEAKSLLTGEDAYSKSLLALILTRISEDNDDQVAKMLPTIDTTGNDIAMMLCFMTYEYMLHTTKAKNLIFKRFGKPEVPEAAPEEAPKDAEEAPEPAPEEAPATEPAPEEAPATEAAPATKPAPAHEEAPEAATKAAPATEAAPEAAPEATVPTQAGGRVSKKKRPSKLRKTKRASRPSRP